MNNSQLPNDVYQTPSPQNGESFDAPEVNKTFHAIEREAVLQAFNQITQDLEMSISGYESREVAEVEVSAEPAPGARGCCHGLRLRASLDPVD